jgi:hypothetical protein
MDNLVRLDDIATEYFNLTPNIARRKAALGLLPVPVFRLADTGRGPYFITKDDLQSYIDSRVKSAVKLHRQMNFR